MWFLVLLSLAVFASAYVVPTESLDVYYVVFPNGVEVRGLDGSVLYSMEAVYPPLASDAVGGCFALVNRPYVYQILRREVPIEITTPTNIELSDDVLNALRQYGVVLPKRLSVVLNFTLPLPPVIIAGVYKGAVASLHTPYGYPHWATSLVLNASVVATNCVDVIVGGVDGSVVVVRNGAVARRFKLPAPVTAAVYSRDGKTAYLGTAGGEVYKLAGDLSRVYTCRGSVLNMATEWSKRLGFLWGVQ